jgi:replicative DNA helicase
VAFLKPGDFFIIRHEWLWRVIQDLYARGDEIHNISVFDALSPDQQDQIGGAAYITELMIRVEQPHYAETFARMVERSAIRRRMLDMSAQFALLAHQESGDIEITLNDAQATFFDFMARQEIRQSASALQIADENYNEVEAAYLIYQTGGMVGLPSGIRDLDEMIGGFHKHKFYILAGRPAMGKTAMVLSILLQLVKAGVPVGMFSLEMNRTELVNRLVAMETGLSTQAIENGRFTDDEWLLFVEANNRISELSFWVNDTPANNITQLRTQAKAWYQEHGIKLILIDYLQLATGDQSSDNRTLEVGTISSGCKNMARELEIPVLAAAQLNREVEKRQDKRPGLADLRESGSLEQDADVVMFMYRDAYYNPNTEDKGIGEIIVGKQRNGPTGTARAIWKPKLTQFVDIGSVETVDFAPYGDGYKDTKAERES